MKLLYTALAYSLLFVQALLGGTYNLRADYQVLDSYPLQKAQFGISYVGSSKADMENVYEILKARYTRNNDKRLQGTWKAWDKTGDPIYQRNSRVSTLLEVASDYGAIGGANLQGPFEHPDRSVYLISSKVDNQWDWEKFSYDSMLYYKHLRGLLTTYGARSDYPFVFGIGHEANNDANAKTHGEGAGCVDGCAFMGNFVAFNKLNKTQGDKLQAEIFCEWYRKTIDNLIKELGDRSRFTIGAGQPHTSITLDDGWYPRFHDLVSADSRVYVPDFIGCHARRNPEGNNKFWNYVVKPTRTVFDDQPFWLTVPVMCNEYGAEDEGVYVGTMRGALRLLTLYKDILEMPDVAYVNCIYNDRFVANNGNPHPTFHAFRFYQNMPQSRTKTSGSKPSDLHVLSSMSKHSRQAALVWRDSTGSSTTHTVNFTFAGADSSWTKARAYLYVISNSDKNAKMSSKRSSANYGMDAYLVSGYPKTINGFERLENYTFEDIAMKQASMAFLLLERLDAQGKPVEDVVLNHSGPNRAEYHRTWQWTARDGNGGVDPSWGYFDVRNWTLFAGIDDVSGSTGSTRASYLANMQVKRGLAGVEFKNASPILRFKIGVETGDLNPPRRDRSSIGALRIDFYNGKTQQFDAAVVLAGNCCPTWAEYSQDHVPWGYGGTDTQIRPQGQKMRQFDDGRDLVVNLDREYLTLTGKRSTSDFVVGGRRVIVSAWVENIEAGMTVRLCDE